MLHYSPMEKKPLIQEHAGLLGAVKAYSTV